jgi:hypothetical protein
VGRLVSSLVRLLADVHQAVVKLDQATGRAPDGVACRIVVPPAVAVPRAAPVVGPDCVVRLAIFSGDRCGWVTTIVSRPGCPSSTAIVRVTRVVTGVGLTAVISPGGADDGRRADRAATVLPARDASNAHG